MDALTLGYEMKLFIKLIQLFQKLGRISLLIPFFLGSKMIDVFSLSKEILSPPYYIEPFYRQMIFIGFNSVPVVGITALFTGAALALQIFSGGTRFNAESVVPSIVAIGMTRELGPVLCGLIVAGRLSSSIAAELGSMKVTEQLDALTSLSVNPVKFLVTPRLLAAIICLPILTLISDIIGILGGMLVGITSLQFSLQIYTDYTLKFLELSDIYSGLIKASGFGVIISLSGCYFGFKSNGGAAGVGKSTTQAVIAASMLILILNYSLTAIMFQK